MKLGFVSWIALNFADPGQGRHEWDTSINDAMRFTKVDDSPARKFALLIPRLLYSIKTT